MTMVHAGWYQNTQSISLILSLTLTQMAMVRAGWFQNSSNAFRHANVKGKFNSTPNSQLFQLFQLFYIKSGPTVYLFISRVTHPLTNLK